MRLGTKRKMFSGCAIDVYKRRNRKRSELSIERLIILLGVQKMRFGDELHKLVQLKKCFFGIN